MQQQDVPLLHRRAATGSSLSALPEPSPILTSNDPATHDALALNHGLAGADPVRRVLVRISFASVVLGLIIIASVSLADASSAPSASPSSSTPVVVQHLGTMTPYHTLDYTPSTTHTPTESCSPVHVSLLARHGSRQPTSRVVANFGQLADKLKLLGPLITSPEFAFMKDWESPFRAVAQGELSYAGELELHGLGVRLAAKLDDVFGVPYQSHLFDIRSTMVPRTGHSGSAFTFGAFQGTGRFAGGFQPVFSYALPEDEDVELRFFGNCPAYTAFVRSGALSEYYAYMNSAVARVAAELSKAAGLQGDQEFSTQDAWHMYQLCGYQVAVQNKTDEFCTIFTEEQGKVLEYTTDLSKYWTAGYGAPINYQIAAPLLRDLLAAMNATVLGQDDAGLATLRFAHAETVLPLMSLLGLFEDSFVLRANSSESDKAARHWKTSNIGPFATNVAMVLSRCAADDFTVALLVNEEQVPFPKCPDTMPDGSCTWADLLKGYASELAIDFDAICKTSLPSEPLSDLERPA